jgi:hypothetical protein
VLRYNLVKDTLQSGFTKDLIEGCHCVCGENFETDFFFSQKTGPHPTTASNQKNGGLIVWFGWFVGFVAVIASRHSNNEGAYTSLVIFVVSIRAAIQNIIAFWKFLAEREVPTE